MSNDESFTAIFKGTRDDFDFRLSEVTMTTMLGRGITADCGPPPIVLGELVLGVDLSWQGRLIADGGLFDVYTG